MAVPYAPRLTAVVVFLARLSRLEELGALAISVGRRMWCGGPDRSSRIPALRRAPRKSTCPQPGWLLGLCQWARGAGDPLGVDPYEFVARLLTLRPVRISRRSLDYCMSMSVWTRRFLEMLAWLVLPLAWASYNA